MKKLYRPVGEKEMQLIAESGFKKFPPRLEWQPIFYPVLNEEYASEIASKWNTTDPFGNYLGFVTAFEISEEEFKKYPIENVGGIIHNELWVPADQLESFNESIQGEIKTLKVYIGKDYKTSESLLVNEIMKTVENYRK
ncbi:ADP-ribosylation/crystallin J1 [uncultured Tenacibaculum sp.]|uniref:ADP-ribosylation/crystallin J1 n=1 Tax=uncultured Tenacibaculum sp. TaxID=174713 RepID=UPI00262B9513|nr:ADP-ribosylation/crystallin J1 [uncultured Tenacibaculum sp.]